MQKLSNDRQNAAACTHEGNSKTYGQHGQTMVMPAWTTDDAPFVQSREMAGVEGGRRRCGSEYCGRESRLGGFSEEEEALSFEISGFVDIG